MAAAAILFSMDSSQKLIRSSEIAREQPYQILMQSNQRFKSPKAFWAAILKNRGFWLGAKKYMGRIDIGHIREK